MSEKTRKKKDGENKNKSSQRLDATTNDGGKKDVASERHERAGRDKTS